MQNVYTCYDVPVRETLTLVGFHFVTSHVPLAQFRRIAPQPLAAHLSIQEGCDRKLQIIWLLLDDVGNSSNSTDR